MADGRRHPQPGDLIEIDRKVYQHWALYMGDGYVIHVTDDGARTVLSSATKAKVKKELLKKVVGNHKWCVNNKYDRSRRPRPVKEIIRCAEKWIGTEVLYDLLSNNCEHFVTELRYGEGVSDQVETTVDNAALAAVGILGTVAAAAAIALSKVISGR